VKFLTTFLVTFLTTFFSLALPSLLSAAQSQAATPGSEVVTSGQNSTKKQSPKINSKKSPKQSTARSNARTGKSLKVSETAKKSVEARPHDPRGFVDDRVTRMLRDLKGRAPRALSDQVRVVSLPVAASRAEWLQAIYSRQLVDASPATGLLSDKLLFYELARREMGPDVDRFLVRSIGLRDFLVSQGLVGRDGRLTIDGDGLEASLFKVFPAGFVARPAVGVAPRETGRGLFKESDEFVAELIKPDTFLYRPEHRRRPVRSSVLGSISSGEAIVLQDDVLQSHAVAGKKSQWREVRVHTYESRILEDANANFWISEARFSKDELKLAQSFVAEFLQKLSPSLLSRQAFSFDVLILPEGKVKIVDIVTNRGKKTAWSSYLDQPRVIGAYTRHFESHAGVRFSGLGGYLLRKNVGNYFAYWGLKIERSRPGVEKVLAWIPPWP